MMRPSHRLPRNRKWNRSRTVRCMGALGMMIALTTLSLMFLIHFLDQDHQRPFLPLQDQRGALLASIQDQQGALLASIQESQFDLDDAIGQPPMTFHLPNWMEDYIAWHRQQLAEMERRKDDWMSGVKPIQIIILRCTMEEAFCGGLSDRLKPLPLVFLAAKRTNRVLFIYWTRPCRLEEFLLPTDRFNWTLPGWLSQQLDVPITSPSYIDRRVISRAGSLWPSLDDNLDDVNTMPLLNVHFHEITGGAVHYDTTEGADAFSNVYHDLFFTIFRPCPAIAHSLAAKMHHLHLRHDQYAVAHYRADYGKEVQRHPILQKKKFRMRMARNAIQCALQLMPQAPLIFFASDTTLPVEDKRVVTNMAQMMHLDHVDNATQPSDYYSTFVDLLLMAHGKCIAYGRGGFGRYANILSANITCAQSHVTNFMPKDCSGA